MVSALYKAPFGAIYGKPDWINMSLLWSYYLAHNAFSINMSPLTGFKKISFWFFQKTKLLQIFELSLLYCICSVKALFIKYVGWVKPVLSLRRAERTQQIWLNGSDWTALPNVSGSNAFAILINHSIRANPEWSGDAKERVFISIRSETDKDSLTADDIPNEFLWQ